MSKPDFSNLSWSHLGGGGLQEEIYYRLQVWVINGSTQKRHNKKCVISRSTRIIRNRHVWHANLFVSTQNDLINTTHLTSITNKYSFYFRFVKYLLYPTCFLNLKRKVSNYKNLKGIWLEIEALQILGILYFCWTMLFWIWVEVYALFLGCKEFILLGSKFLGTNVLEL